MKPATAGALASIALGGAGAYGLMFWIMAEGPGVTPDSVVYIEAARNLGAGTGLYADGQPMIQYPPVYPLLLAAAGLLEPDLVRAARILHAVLFGANTILAALAVRVGGGRHLFAAAAAILLFVCSAPILTTHAMAWSEPAFFTFSLVGFVLLSRYVAHPAGPLLVASALAMGLAAATRYIGVTLVAPMAFGLLCLGQRAGRRRLQDVALAIPLVCLLPGAWCVRNFLASGSIIGRNLALHPTGAAHIEALIDSLYDFLLPVSVPRWAKAAQLAISSSLVLGALGLVHGQRHRNSSEDAPRATLPSLLVLFAGAYVPSLFFSISFVDAATPLDSRILFPVAGLLIVAVVSLAESASTALRKPWVWWMFIVLCVLSGGVKVGPALSAAVMLHKNGFGYTSRQWKSSETVAYLRTLPGEVKIYSNGPEAIRFLTGRPAVMVPSRVSPITESPGREYDRQMGRMCREIREGEAMVVHFRAVWRWYLPTEAEIEASCKVSILRGLADGTIYGHR